MKSLVLFLVVLALAVFGVQRLVAWLRTVQAGVIPIGYGGDAR